MAFHSINFFCFFSGGTSCLPFIFLLFYQRFRKVNERTSRITCRLQFLLIDESSGESPLTVEYPGNGVVRFNVATRVAIKRYNHAVTWANRHFISLIRIRKKYESTFKEISKLHLLVVIYECTSGQRKHSVQSTGPLKAFV